MIITRAPLRLPLGGGGTDLPGYSSQHGGLVISVAINKYVYINLNRPHAEDVIRLKYSRTEEVKTVDQIQHPLLRESLKLTGVGAPLEISAMADVPAGTGLGSSGSFLVALLAALHAHGRDSIPLKQLAEEACRVEIEMAGQPVGKHDQYLATYGGLTCLEIDGSGGVSVSRVNAAPQTFEELRYSLVLFYTGLRRESFDILDDQNRKAAASDRRVLESLHMIKEIGQEMKAALEENNVNRVGELMDLHWNVKKRMSNGISNGQINRWYEIGLKCGALGGKLMGAGGGGFLVFFCPRQSDSKCRVRAAMTAEGLREMPFEFDFEGAKVIANFRQ